MKGGHEFWNRLVRWQRRQVGVRTSLESSSLLLFGGVTLRPCNRIFVHCLVALSIVSCAGSDERAFEGPASLPATPIFHNPTSTLQAVHFVDAERGWAVGVNGTVLATTDGGRSWTTQSVATNGALLSVDFVDAECGWAVGDDGTVLATTDSGRTWTAQGGGTPF